MEYWEINEETLDDVVTKVEKFKTYTGASVRKYFEKELRNAENMNCAFVLFHAREEWQHMFINREYSVPFVMRQLEDRLSD